MIEEAPLGVGALESKGGDVGRAVAIERERRGIRIAAHEATEVFQLVVGIGPEGGIRDPAAAPRTRAARQSPAGS